MSELWYPGAIKRPGPAWKNRGSTNSNYGVVLHSAEGTRYGLEYEIMRVDRGSAWHFESWQDGTIIQRYPINAVLAHAADWGGDDDGLDGNGEGTSIEHEGGGGSNPSEPLTEAQLAASVKLVQWLAEQGQWQPSRSRPGKTLFEHRELSDTGTQCPSGRIPWEAYVARPIPTALKWLAYLLPKYVDRKTRWVRTEPVSGGYVDDVFEVVNRRKV